MYICLFLFMILYSNSSTLIKSRFFTINYELFVCESRYELMIYNIFYIYLQIGGCGCGW